MIHNGVDCCPEHVLDRLRIDPTPGMRHPDCNYDAGLIKGIWFCNKCGWIRYATAKDGEAVTDG